MKIYNMHYVKTNLEHDHKVTDVLIPVTTKELALQLFRSLVEELRKKHLNEAISIHECMGIDPCDFEYNGLYITFELVTDKFKFEVDVDEDYVHETFKDVTNFWTIFDFITSQASDDDLDID